MKLMKQRARGRTPAGGRLAVPPPGPGPSAVLTHTPLVLLLQSSPWFD